MLGVFAYTRMKVTNNLSGIAQLIEDVWRTITDDDL